ncbi:hypothetical protein BRE01_65580 [Brevibacillus reuszeri]|uniref:Uncharacterized protein n=2 Tax=Brevibacillus reuszeri TaxID=54915 RepID=A0ABQ0TYN6_9BACL|nr:hypothetical protein [Brevibacillus reuszeri]MED1861078.1 hypothetical protein [Brevibacillus reuszeri]GED72856.1 hypothetical protein BRE01_65580 [Brevibacillus reuszeri]
MASHPTDRQMHPILIDVRQIAPNQILMMYDLRTDLESATNVANYWIRSNSVRPTGISSVGMSPALSAANAIRPDMGMITPVNNSRRRFVITFRENAMSGVLHVVLPCFVNLEGRTGFRGENWGTFSSNMFISM